MEYAVERACPAEFEPTRMGCGESALRQAHCCAAIIDILLDASMVYLSHQSNGVAPFKRPRLS